MESLPKGVYRQRKQLADGTVKTYYRLRSTGKAIAGEPGTPEFEASLAFAMSSTSAVKAGTWGALIEAYRLSPGYRKLEPPTKKAYERRIACVGGGSGKSVREMRRSDFLMVRDAIAVEHPQAANHFIMVMSTILDFAVDRDLCDFNPLVRVRRIKGGSHKTWNDAQIKYAIGAFPEHLRRAVILALYTGQREGDCCAMKWSQYDGTAIEVSQEKTGAFVWIPAHRVLKKEMDAWRAEGERETVLVNSLGRSWPISSFSSTICLTIQKHPALAGMVFHGLRKAAAARLAEAGCSTHEIAAITGHESLAMIELYTKRADQKVRAASAMRKLELVKD